MNPVIPLILELAIGGFLVTGYLLYHKIRRKNVSCPVTQKCNEVLNSKWSRILYIPNDVIGCMFYLAVIVLTFLIYKGYDMALVLTIISGIAAVSSIFLTYIQAKVLKEYCFYCLSLNAVNLILFVATLKLSI